VQADIMQALILNESLQGATAMFNEAREQRHQQLLHQKQQQNRKRRRYNPSVQASFLLPALCANYYQSPDMQQQSKQFHGGKRSTASLRTSHSPVI
jgi:hypothetical protein